MRIIVTKPRDGKMTVRLEDRRGLTGMRETRSNVDLANVGLVVEGLVEGWQTKRQAIEDVRKGLTS